MNLYSFDDSQPAIEIHRPDTPNPWINYLTNGRFHAFVSQAGGGFAWFGSAVTRRLTRYRQYNLPIDSPGSRGFVTPWKPWVRRRWT
ncbi:MAG: hypothetical protein JJU05_04170 [Verrucomicrobia bacterium]|nr:hypothetical protein [Verrucomicrobiota bacterium]MCH8525527.1 hypothetical protein [Kiritimatiellia bacterium]